MMFLGEDRGVGGWFGRVGLCVELKWEFGCKGDSTGKGNGKEGFRKTA